jgi:hypothetical protein
MPCSVRRSLPVSRQPQDRARSRGARPPRLRASRDDRRWPRRQGHAPQPTAGPPSAPARRPSAAPSRTLAPPRGGVLLAARLPVPGKRTHTRLLLLLVRERRWARSYERVGSAVRVDRFRGGASWPLLSGRGNCPATLDWIYDFTLAPAACPNPTPIHKFSWSA